MLDALWPAAEALAEPLWKPDKIERKRGQLPSKPQRMVLKQPGT